MIATHSEKPNESLLHWLQKAFTAMGKRTLRERCLKPIADIEELNVRQNRIEALRNCDRTILESTIKGCADLPRLYRRFQLGKGTTTDLLQMLMTYEKALILIDVTKDKGVLFQAEDSEVLTIHIRSLLDRWDADRIRRSRDQMPGDCVAVGSQHPWRRGYHAELDSLENAWQNLEGEVLLKKRAWDDILEEGSSAITWTLKEDMPFTFTTTARRGASLAAAAKSQLKTDITCLKHGSSTVVTLNSDYLHTANEKARQIRREWRASVDAQWQADWQSWMSSEIAKGVLDLLTDFIGRLDAECAFARISDLYGYTKPIYVESTEEQVAGVKICELRHPIIERIHTETPYVSHNLAFGSFHSAELVAEGSVASSSSGILLYGVNAAGKSSLGKALGLAVLMAQCGIPVPATAMTLIPYTGLFTRILGNDNLWAGMSSFVVEMTEFRSILRSADERTLVIGDELCSGTETASATAIVAAGIRTLSERSSHFFFATHLHELGDIPEIASDKAVASYHLSVHPDIANGCLVYDRLLRQGRGSAMYGLEVCRGLDMDKVFLERAFDYRKRYFSDEGKAHASRYNPKVVVQMCEVCGSTCQLETHHIVQQSDADEKKQISPGKHKNTKENLVCLCDSCHNKHHKGLLEIQGWVQTTDGRKLKLKTSL
jgi:DNA mismatch repair protein MutS